MSQFKTAFDEFKSMNLFEKVYTIFYIILILVSLQALILEDGPMLPVTDSLNYYQGLILHELFNSNLIYPKLTLVIIFVVAALPIIILKKFNKGNFSNKDA